MNYAEQLETEAYSIARRRLIRAAEKLGHQDRLDGWLARLDIIHAQAMDAAKSWAPPKTKLPPLTAENVSSATAIPLGYSLAAEAQESQS